MPHMLRLNLPQVKWTGLNRQCHFNLYDFMFHYIILLLLQNHDQDWVPSLIPFFSFPLHRALNLRVWRLRRIRSDYESKVPWSWRPHRFLNLPLYLTSCLYLKKIHHGCTWGKLNLNMWRHEIQTLLEIHLFFSFYHRQ